MDFTTTSGDQASVKICSGVQSMSSPKLIGSPLKRLNRDEMNGIERLHIQLSYSWLNSFVGKRNHEWTRTILKFP